MFGIMNDGCSEQKTIVTDDIEHTFVCPPTVQTGYVFFDDQQINQSIIGRWDDAMDGGWIG